MNEVLLAKLKEVSELDADKHDGSYELMRETIRAYANIIDDTELDFNDLNTVYLMSVGTWKHGIEPKKKLILNDSHLKDDDKQHLVTVIDKIAENAKNDIYSNKEPGIDSKFGMFGTGFYSFVNKTDNKSVNGFIKLCTEIIDMNDENEIFDKAELILDENFHGMKAASASMVLHCLKPYVFPILNGNMGSNDIFKALDIKLTRKGDIDTYIENCRRIKAFRDKNLPFKNYRILDMEAWSLGGDKDPKIDCEETIRDTEEQYFPLLSEYDPQISKEKWFEILTNEELIQKKWLVVLKCMLEMGGEATCKQISKTYGKTSSFYNINARSIANVVIKETGCDQYIIYGKKKSWPVLFLGRNLKNSEDGVFSWKLRPELEEALKQMDLTEIEINADKGEEDRNMDKNMILYGPPGTGKTYNTVLYAVAICDGRSISELEEKLNKDPEYYDVLLARYNELKNVEGRVAFTTFHQSYGYEEFIEGIRPVISNEGDESDVSDVRYEFADGVFKGFCKKASEDTEENEIPYVFIIDEINRGNISKIFGELITLIETTKRIGSDEPASAILPYTKEQFGVPNNVYIIGTMNTADRSISLMDTALRRRFKFVEMMPKVSILTRLGITIVDGINIPEMLKTINDRIEYLFDREHTIGHAYFTSLAKDASIENLASIFQNAIIPLLQEYFYEDYSKIQLILGDNGKQDDYLKFILDSKVNVKKIFKGDASDVEDLGDKKYEIQVKAFYNAESYKQIY